MYSTSPLILVKVDDEFINSNPVDTFHSVFFGLLVTLRYWRLVPSFPSSLWLLFFRLLWYLLLHPLVKCWGFWWFCYEPLSVLILLCTSLGHLTSIHTTSVANFMLKILQSEKLSQVAFVSKYSKWSSKHRLCILKISGFCLWSQRQV